jgi:predicted PurR-regulated permease PerM
MSLHDRSDTDSGQLDKSALLDVPSVPGSSTALVMLCYQVFAPFLTLMIWALILAVALYPLHQYLAAKIGGKQGLAATIVVLLGVTLIVVPTAVLMSSLGDSVHQLIIDVQENTLEIPAPPDAVATWPVVGEKLHAIWSAAYTDPACSDPQHAAEDRQPRQGGARLRCRHWRRLLQFLAAFIVAGIIMAFGKAGSRATLAIFERFAGEPRGRRVHQAIHGDHTGRCKGHRRRLHSGDPRRPFSVARRHTLCGCAGDDRPGTQDCPCPR